MAALVVVMVVVGGTTRLTESGLSMVRWEPVSGIVPPLDEAGWRAEVDAYKAYPEYRSVNAEMELPQFKVIFFREYLHGLLGRLLALALALPFLWFLMRRAISTGYRRRICGLVLLVGFRAVIGWWMVASGLVDRPDVAHERLALHLTTALACSSCRSHWEHSSPDSVPGASTTRADDARRVDSTNDDEHHTALVEPVDNPVTVQFMYRWVAAVVAGFPWWWPSTCTDTEPEVTPSCSSPRSSSSSCSVCSRCSMRCRSCSGSHTRWVLSCYGWPRCSRRTGRWVEPEFRRHRRLRRFDREGAIFRVVVVAGRRVADSKALSDRFAA